MDLSMRWLADYVDCDMPIKEFVSGITLSGSKVECYNEEGDYLENVVVGQVKDIVPHPNSDHMFICQLDVGEGALVQIVTGAQNVKKDDFVPVAKHKSTVLHEGKTVKITRASSEAKHPTVCCVLLANWAFRYMISPMLSKMVYSSLAMTAIRQLARISERLSDSMILQLNLR